jgi:NAD(P)-dependent dehydrogenase (short-subunit alcohol dehydrogenase family)
VNHLNCKTMMILGGYGSAGICIARLLLQETDLNLVLAGRNGTKADQAAEQLNTELGETRVRAMQVDASNAEESKKAFRSCDAVIVCVPITSSKIGGGIVQAAFDAGINYIDLNLDEDKQQLLRQLAGPIKDAGRYFMTEAGYMPGTPSMMAFMAADRLDSLRRIQFGGLMKENNASYGSVSELIVVAADPAHVYYNGDWREVGKTATRQIDFGPGFGKQTCYPMDLYELRRLPADLGFNEAGFYSAGVNPIADLILFVWIITGLYKYNWSLQFGAKLVMWAVRKFTKPPYTTTIAMEAEGRVNDHNEKITLILSHEDPYVSTAIATVAGILQLLDGSIGKPGVHIMGHGVEPNRYLADLERLGMSVHIDQQPIT